MTPQQIEEELNRINEWIRRRDLVQIQHPLDDDSKNNLSTFVKTGTAASTTQSISLSGNAQSITVPAQPTGFLVGTIDGQNVQIPYYSV